MFFVDSDDWIDSDTLEVLLKTALLKDTDVTGCCAYFNYPNGTEKSRASAQIDICDTRSLIKWVLEGGRHRCQRRVGQAVQKSLFENLRFDESCDFCEDDEFSFRMARKAKGYVRIADAKYHYFQNFNGMLRSGSYVSEAPLRVMSRIESDQAVANDPELSELAHKKKISALFMIYLKYLRAGDRQNALRISHMMRELISRYGYC